MNREPAFSSFEDYKSKIEAFYASTTKQINECLAETEHISIIGLTPVQEALILGFLIESLKDLTKKSEDWCEEVSTIIVVSINSFIKGLIAINKADLTPEEYSKLINFSIRYQLEEGYFLDTIIPRVQPHEEE